MIYIIEDDENIRNLVQVALNGSGYETAAFETAEEALGAFKVKAPQLAIFDLMLPGMDGLEAIRKIRANDAWKKLPVLVLTAKDKEYDKVAGLDGGADDYMTKPFSPAELTARIDALYRRIDSDGSSNQIELKHGPFVLNTRNRTLDIEGRRIKLTQVEYAIVKLFMQNPGRALSREDILAAVWGRDYDGELKIVDVNIRRLRIKIEDDTANPTYITTVWGFGYKWGA